MLLLWSNPGLFTWVPMGCELHHDRDLLWPRVVPSPAALGYVVTTESHTSACPESFKWRETKPELKAGAPSHHRSAYTADAWALPSGDTHAGEYLQNV